jgi:predicted ATPase
MLLIKRHELGAGVSMLTAAVAELRRARYVQYDTAFLAARAEELRWRWIIAELLRLKGELVLLDHAPNATAAAEDHFRQSLEWAGRQGALAWELRTTMGFTRLRHRQRKTSEARKLLSAVCARFTEGFDTTDLVSAKALLQTLGLLEDAQPPAATGLVASPGGGRHRETRERHRPLQEEAVVVTCSA